MCALASEAAAISAAVLAYDGLCRWFGNQPATDFPPSTGGRLVVALVVAQTGQGEWITGGGVLSGVKGSTTAEKITELFLAGLSRKPSASELERFVGYVDKHAGQGLEDAYWAILNTTEFLTRH